MIFKRNEFNGFKSNSINHNKNNSKKYLIAIIALVFCLEESISIKYNIKLGLKFRCSRNYWNACVCFSNLTQDCKLFNLNFRS